MLSFSLLPDATSRFCEALICLAKFGESVSLEARSEKLNITALNSSRTAYASFTLDARSFFVKYDFNARRISAQGSDRFTCQLSNRALQAVFKGRGIDVRGRESVIERCDVIVQDQPDKAECRLVVKLLCKHGMTKTYRLSYESIEVMHALFDKTAASQGWTISSRVLREYVEFFGPKTEQLDIVATDGKASFISYTEKIQNGKEVLKQPLETAIVIHTEDFEDFHMQDNMHITISVKDFKSIVTHAETLRTSLSCHCSLPRRPLQFSYHNFGIYSEFTLMTTGSAEVTPTPKFVSNRSMSSQPSVSRDGTAPSQTRSEMPPPARPRSKKPTLGTRQQQPTLAHATEPSMTDVEQDPDSLFMPRDNDDRPWDPPNYDAEDGEDMLGWDASNDNLSASFRPTFRDSASIQPDNMQQHNEFRASQEGLEPTQRLSQLHGMFD